jgi:drug/metabolite transporter (DMT)-like permease
LPENNQRKVEVKNKLKSTTFLAIIACLLWASAFAVIKIGLQYTTPLRFAGLRFILAGLMLLPLIGSYRTVFQYIRKNVRLILLIAFLQTFVQYALFYSGLNLVPGSLGAIINGSSPLFIAFTAHFLMPDDRLTIPKLGIIFMGIAGIALVSLSNVSGKETSNLIFIGIVMLFLTNINAGFTNVIIARDAKHIPPLVLSSTSLIIGGVLLFLVSLPVEGFAFEIPPLNYYLSIIWLSFLSAAAYSIWNLLLQRQGVKVSALNFWKFIIPVFGAILSWLLIPDESPDMVSIAGITITAIALVLFNRQNTVQSKEPAI